VAFVLDVASDLPNLCIDPDRMLQVLLNLIGNAIKFTLSGTITLRVAMQTENILGISVADTGIGIRGEDLERIFEKFHQVHQGNTVFEQAKGTGLGLTICRQIVRHYGGAIWAESDPGCGSVFRITLPVRAEGDGCGAGTPAGEPVC
jgi:signal transduction histidine kinase